MKKIWHVAAAVLLLAVNVSADDHDHDRYRSKNRYSREYSNGSPGGTTDTGIKAANDNITHPWISSYDGPQTCIACHQTQAREMLNSLHMKWEGPTPELINTNGKELGKGNGGINTFCTYAPSSKGACYSCHVRADGNAPHPPELNDIDCLMCHNDTYQRKFVSDPDNTETVVNVLGETSTYLFGAVDAESP